MNENILLLFSENYEGFDNKKFPNFKTFYKMFFHDITILRQGTPFSNTISAKKKVGRILTDLYIKL